MEEIIKKSIEITVPIIFSFFAGYHIQKLKNRPKITTHGCRISCQDVYTYFRSDNKPSWPACPHLLKDGKCNYLINTDPIKKQMLSNKNGECYLAFWDK